MQAAVERAMIILRREACLEWLTTKKGHSFVSTRLHPHSTYPILSAAASRPSTSFCCKNGRATPAEDAGYACAFNFDFSYTEF